MAWCSIFERRFNELISQMIRLRDHTTGSLWQQQAGFDDPWQPNPSSLTWTWLQVFAPSFRDQHRFTTAQALCSTSALLRKQIDNALFSGNYYLLDSLPACACWNNQFESIFIKEWINTQSSGFWCALIKAPLKTKCVLTAELSKASTLCFDSCAVWVFLQCRNSFSSQCQRNCQCRSHIPGSPELSLPHQGFIKAFQQCITPWILCCSKTRHLISQWKRERGKSSHIFKHANSEK